MFKAVVKPRALPVWLLLAACGCSPEHYEHSADVAANRILRDRERETLGYNPQVEAPVKTQAEPTTRAYEKLPLTSISPPTRVTVERMTTEMPLRPLGPEQFNYDPNTPLDLIPQEMTQFQNGGGMLGPDAPDSRRQRLDLFQCIQYAVQHSRPYENKMADLFIATLDVSLQRHLFEPRPFMESTYTIDGGQKDVNYRSALTATNAIGVRQQLPYGGEIVAKQLVQTIEALNDKTQDGSSAGVVMQASIPLLRGAGLVNLEPLIKSERELVYAVRDFEAYRRSFAVDIASQYLRLVNQQQQIANRVRNYRNLRQLTQRTQALYEAGKLSFLDVQRSLQNQLSSENDLIAAISGYQSTLDDFKIVLGMDVEAELEVVAMELAISVPAHRQNQAIEAALRYRLELQTTKDRIDDARRNVSNAKNGLLPSLNFAGTTYGGTAGGGSSLDRFSGDSVTYNAGLVLDVPLDNVAERNAYRRSLITLERAQRDFVTVKQQVISDVRDVDRSIAVADATLKIQKRSLDLARKRLELANELLMQGKKGALDVVDAESALLSAQDAYDRAKTNMQSLILQYLRDTGTLRMDPQAGSLGRAMDRASNQAETAQRLLGENKTPPLE